MGTNVATPSLGAGGSFDTRVRYRLSRHIQIRPERDAFVVESLITGRRESLPTPGSLRLLLSLATPTKIDELLDRVGSDPGTRAIASDFLRRCRDQRLITAVGTDGEAEEDEIDSLAHWEPHDLAFHLRSRPGRNPYPVGGTWHLSDVVAPEPARRGASTDVIDRVPLHRPDLDRLRAHDWTVTESLENRRSRYSTEPVTSEALGELLFRACRVTGRSFAGSEEIARKVYPSGGSLHSLELYVASHRCVGIPPGGYRYDAFEHCLELTCKMDDNLTELLRDAQRATGQLHDLPSILLIFAARFRRVSRKYQSLAYHLILQEVGAAYQTLYLVAETLGLAISALGSGDSDRFSRTFSTDFFAESSVGEMIVGGRART